MLEEMPTVLLYGIEVATVDATVVFRTQLEHAASRAAQNSVTEQQVTRFPEQAT
jgi:hypothetical protein